MLLASAKMLEHLGLQDEAFKLKAAVNKVLEDQKVRTRDLGGFASTSASCTASRGGIGCLRGGRVVRVVICVAGMLEGRREGAALSEARVRGATPDGAVFERCERASRAPLSVDVAVPVRELALFARERRVLWWGRLKSLLLLRALLYVRFEGDARPSWLALCGRRIP